MSEFRFIPIVGNSSNASVQIVRLANVSTKHDSSDTDAGRMYGKVLKVDETIIVKLYNDYKRRDSALIASGSMEAFVEPFDLSPNSETENPPLVSGVAVVNSFTSDSNFVAIPTFATDVDIQSTADAMQNFPGYDEQFGLAIHFASAMEQILTSSLPAAIPTLFSSLEVNPYSAVSGEAEYPDVSKIENPAALRRATANLAKALSWEESGHMAEAQEIIRQARALFVDAMKDVAAANAPKTEAKTIVTSGLSIGTFTRG
jgi:hypothetical protein